MPNLPANMRRSLLALACIVAFGMPGRAASAPAAVITRSYHLTTRPMYYTFATVLVSPQPGAPRR